MWKKSVASTPRAWALRNADHSRRAGARRGAGPSRAWRKHPADGRDPDAVPEPAQLAVHALATPARILGTEPDDQVAQFLGNRRPAWWFRLRPFACHHALVPGQQRAWGDDPVLTQLPGQQPGQCGKHGPVAQSGFGAGNWRRSTEAPPAGARGSRRPSPPTPGPAAPARRVSDRRTGRARERPQEAIVPRTATATDQPSTAIPRKH